MSAAGCGRKGPDGAVCQRMPGHVVGAHGAIVQMHGVPVGVVWDYINPAEYHLPASLRQGLEALGLFLYDLGWQAEIAEEAASC